MKSTLLPDSFIKCINPEQRRKLSLKTADEIAAQSKIKLEKDLKKQVLAILEGHRGIVVFHSRMDKKTTRPKGEPDLLFAVDLIEDSGKGDGTINMGIVACGWELKLPGEKLTQDERDMFTDMQNTPNAWTCRVITSVGQALEELRRLGL